MKHITIQKNHTNQINIDEQEIHKFNTHGSTWWDLYGPFKSLHHINSIRLHYILQHSCGLFGKKILDVGCGGGILSESMAQVGAEVVGLDMSATSLTLAKSHASYNKLSIHYIQETIETHAKNHINYYDIVTCMEVLEHVPYPPSIIHACAKILKKNGLVFFSTLNRTLKAWLLIILGAEHILNILPKGTHNFNKFITPNELLNWIDCTILEEQNITGIQYNPFTHKCTFTHDISTNYILYAQKNIT